MMLVIKDTYVLLLKYLMLASKTSCQVQCRILISKTQNDDAGPGCEVGSQEVREGPTPASGRREKMEMLRGTTESPRRKPVLFSISDLSLMPLRKVEEALCEGTVIFHPKLCARGSQILDDCVQARSSGRTRVSPEQKKISICRHGSLKSFILSLRFLCLAVCLD